MQLAKLKRIIGKKNFILTIGKIILKLRNYYIVVNLIESVLSLGLKQ
jgi:hypothetical protein